jgi:hypothetical protein
MNRIKTRLSGYFLECEGVLFHLLERLTGYRREKKAFKSSTGYRLNLKNPESFSEKVVWKKIYDRNPLLPVVADKYRVRRYVEDILGRKTAKEILVPLLYVTDKPETIPFESLACEYIIKPNHASMKKLIIEKGSMVDRRYIIDCCRKWLSRPFGAERNEWAYQKIKRKIVIEKLLRDRNGRLPDDYKFFVIHGRCHLIQVIYDRVAGKPTLGQYTPEWEYLNVRGNMPQASCRPKPENLERMVAMAESLGAHFDAVRVDLYLVDGNIYFGELTNYHMSGRFMWTPASFNYEMGAKWRLVPGYWKKDPYITNLNKRAYLW